MNWSKFQTYNESLQNAFETLCNQLFERHLNRTHNTDLIKFRVINGAGGDGGIEAYGQLISGNLIAVQAKWFPQSLGDSEIRQIKKSILTAKQLRLQIKEYIICIPHKVNSLKIGRGKKPTTNHEEDKINNLIDNIHSSYPDLKLTWWFDNEILTELQNINNEGVHKFWFDKEVLSLDFLTKHFILQKKGWLNERYIPELHGQGIIHDEYQKLCFSKQYRNELSKKLAELISTLNFCLTQIELFIPTNQIFEINDELTLIKLNLIKFLEEFKNIAIEINLGNDFYKPIISTEVNLWKTKLKLEKLKATNLQKNILPKLISSLDIVHKYALTEYLEYFAYSFNQKIRLVIGDPGTGKTHGLANCVETHLAEKSPAIIIQAKGTPFNDWTAILSKTLGINNWSRDEILSALETLSIKIDVQKATSTKPGEEFDREMTKAIICIDGLEEEIEHEKDWYERIRECEQLASDYPRIRFIFSARRYFYSSEENPKRGIFEDVFLPREGDVSITEIAPIYFSKDHYNIQLSSPSIIRAIDSLLALRLFCNEYQNKSLSEADKIVTATRGLINLKIERLNEEYISRLKGNIGSTRNPIMDSLEIIANFFYTDYEIDHEQLVELISPVLKNYLDVSDIDSLIDYLAENAFVVRFERIEEEGILKKRKHFYSITYQSLIEHIISEKIYHEIKNTSLNRIPQFLHEVMIQPLEFNPNEVFNPLEISPNEKIIHNIIINLFLETGKLIGENNFLSEGFDQWEIKKYQLLALSKAPAVLTESFKSKIDNLFFGGYSNLSYVLQYLIIPSSGSIDSVYGTEYLHQKLINLSTFERDKIWSGMDMYEKSQLSEIEKLTYDYGTINIAFREFGVGKPFLFEKSLHNEKALIFAWGLSTIDQELRNELRISLTGWAIKNPFEFLLLLKKIFNCNDPQIQEDLSSIMLGVASKLKDKDGIKELAFWSIESIFSNLNIYRNVIVRQGFRAIVERAFQYGLISKDEVETSRPKQMQNISLLTLEQNLKKNSQGESYPIVHDLAWYVIGKAYDDFLEFPTRTGNKLKDNDCGEAQNLLNKYRVAYNNKNLFASQWGMAAAIAYIKGLGLTRTKGNWHTQASHGVKSKVFTYEEKYTWLAVHYIQGYLSDYVPVKKWSDKREFIKDYTEITDIPNPGESVIDLDKIIKNVKVKNDWIVKEVLSNELETGISINLSISNWVNQEPVFNLENWLEFDSKDFQINEPNRKWIALLNNTGLHDSKGLGYTSFRSTACLIKKEQLPTLLKIIETKPDSLHFITRMDGLHSTPSTDTYCNPTDIVWMTWLEEDGIEETFYDDATEEENYLHNTITQVIQNNFNGESYISLPSKKIRNIIDCYELVENELQDPSGKTLAFNHKKSDGAYKDSQEIVLVDKEILEKLINEEGYKLVWFIELFKKKNPLNEALDKDFYVQKTRKYFVWSEKNEKKSLKFWDEWFSNIRNKVEG